jgi:transglutaminase-like putative cysteine protease
MNNGEKAGLAFAAVGVAAAIGGIFIYQKGRSKASAGGGPVGAFGYAAPLPSVRSTTRSGDMTVKHYYDRTMPIEKRVAILQKLVEDSIKDGEMRKLALQITSSCPARDDRCEARAVYEAVKRRVRYTGDVAPIKHTDGSIEGVDYFQTAKRTWEIQGGDCDDQAVLNATLLTLNGIPARFRITAPRTKNRPLAGDPGWAHIYATAGIPKNNPSSWVALDTTIPGQFFGKEAPYGRAVDFIA